MISSERARVLTETGKETEGSAQTGRRSKVYSEAAGQAGSVEESTEIVGQTGAVKDSTEASKVRWTPEQQSVISLRDRSMLVSAAAGSGKTAVLVERIISMITDRRHPIDVDQLLVVTFTNAAAAEMRERVLNAIEQAAEKDPANLHLQRQMTLIHNAHITTIDSFCLDVIRNHFHKIHLEPGFRIADEGELKLLREDVCDEVLESYYQAKDPRFLTFADSYSGAKNDLQIKEMILRLYDFSQSYPWPEEWLSGCAKQYRADSLEELEQKKWIADFLSYLHVRITGMAESYRQVYQYTLDEDGPQVYEGTIKDDLRQLEELINCGHLQEWQEKLSTIDFKNLPAARKYTGSEAKKNAVTESRKWIKKQVQDLKKKYFASDMQVQLELLGKTAGMVEILIGLTTSFAKCFAEEKAKKNIVDFSDVEHNALSVLVDVKTKQPTETAAEYRKQFREIMIDEYQDSNYVQEALLTAVSGIPERQENLFMVGDVKQSIYRFRLARPELFMEKYDTFSLDDGDRQRVDLHKNFRSRGEVLDVVNDIFYRIMGRDLGNVEYDREAALYQGADYEPYEDTNCCQPECILVEEDIYSDDNRMTEARVIAQRIRELIGEQEIPGKQYKDIVILLRSLSGWAESFQKVFEQEGIPLIVSSRTGYFSAQEVQIVLAMLRIIDNPRQDIPLAAVMKSMIGGFSAAELAQIKAKYPGFAFYECVRKLASESENQGEEEGQNPDYEENESGREKPDLFSDKRTDDFYLKNSRLRKKTAQFVTLLDSFRKRVPYTPIHLLLQQIYDETGYRNFVTALPAGEQRRANLDMLLEKAIAYENTSYHGLFHFVRYIDRLMKYDVDYGEAEIISEQENAVRLMTIHKSKGLEFPIVFAAGMGKQFNMQDSSSSMIFHPEYGIGLKWFDLEKRTKSDTLIRQIFSIEAKKENLGEELRILYVALTRAKEKLILTGFRKDTEEKTYKRMQSYEKLDFTARMDAKCYWDWVLPALGSYGEKYSIQTRSFEDRLESEQKKQTSLSEERRKLENELSSVDDTLFSEIRERLSWQYPYENNELLKQKVSVSEIKHRAMDEFREVQDGTGEQELFPQEIPVPYVPKFVRETELNQGALRGTVVHRFLECFDFASIPEFADWESAEAYLIETADALVGKERMSAGEVSLLNMYQMYQFLITDTAKRIKLSAKQGLLTKEQPFVMFLPARRVWKQVDSDDPVLVQGIIDVFWEEEDGIVLLDYKTDRVDTAQELILRYQEQLRLYAEALNRTFKDKKVKDILIYSFRLNETIPILLSDA